MLSPSYTLSHHILTTHLEENPIFSPISYTGDLRLREMKLLVQATQPATGKKRIRTQSAQPQSWGIVISILLLNCDVGEDA